MHPYNSILFDSLTPLINCYNRLGELQNSAAMLRKLIEVISSNPAIAEHHPEKADFYWNLGDVLLSLIEQRGPSLPKKMVARYRQEAHESFEKAAQIRTVCYGAQHPTTLAAIKAVGRS